MIFVDEIRHPPKGTVAAYTGPLSCHMISDESREELVSFASAIGMPQWWLRFLLFPHFELSPNWRRKAIAAGAIDCAGLVGQIQFNNALMRFREANPQLFQPVRS